ncbi:MAG: glycosyltransferase family 2 protein [Chryseolinea sp.]
MLENFLFGFFLLNTAYVLVLSVAGLFYKRLQVKKSNVYSRIAVLVPCYKEDGVVLSTTHNLLTLKYPKELFDIIIIADSLKEDTISLLSKTEAIIIPVSFEKSTKSKSLNYAMSHLSKQYDIAVVLDADNIPVSNFLEDVNDLFNQGYPIIQCQRVAKNTGSPMALLDGISEAINNHLFRQGSNALGLSSALIGSGMAFPFQVLQHELSLIDSPVEDKALQIALVERGYKIYYRKGTLVFDEKVDSPEAYKNQRRRWIAGQYQMLRDHFSKGIKLLFKGNINYFNIAVLHNFFPSRINSLFLLFCFSTIMTVLYPQLNIIARWWSVTFLYVLALFIAIPRVYYSKNLFQAILLLPTVIVKTIQAIFQSKNANKSFIHTEHKSTEIDTTYQPKQ